MHPRHGYGHHGGWPDWGAGGLRGEGRRMRRGDVRALLLIALQDGPGHGYELISRLEQRSGGAWRPSAGSVYPTLQLLDEQELVTSTERDGKRVYELTEAGRTAAAESAARRDLAFDSDAPYVAGNALREAVHSLAMATRQVVIAGDAAMTERATGIVREARQAIYHLLADQ